MRLVADENGIVRVPVTINGDSASFGINGIDEHTFAPGAEIMIADDRLQAVATKIFAPMGGAVVALDAVSCGD